MGSKSLFCHLVHTVGADLYFYPSSLLTHQGNVECLIAVCFRMVQPVAQTVWMTLVDFTDGYVDIEAFVYFVCSHLWCKDDAHSKNVVNLIEGNVLVLHLIPNRIRALHACFDFVFYA